MKKSNKLINQNVWYAAILMLGAYVFGFNFHNIIHEYGHAFAVWLQSGTMTGFYLHPFNACYNTSTYVPNHILLYAGGGFLGLPLTLLFAILAWRFRSVFLAPFIATCYIGFTITGRHMLTDQFIGYQSDYTFMTSLGFPFSIILIVGLIYLAIGIFVRILYLPLFGVDYDMKLSQRIFIFEMGNLPYIAAIGLYNIIILNYPVTSSIYALIMGALFFAFEAWLSLWLPKRSRIFRSIKYHKPKKIHLAVAWIAGITLIAIMVSVSIPAG